jgi:hypothetical protein
MNTDFIHGFMQKIVNEIRVNPWLRKKGGLLIVSRVLVSTLR